MCPQPPPSPTVSTRREVNLKSLSRIMEEDPFNYLLGVKNRSSKFWESTWWWLFYMGVPIVCLSYHSSCSPIFAYSYGNPEHHAPTSTKVVAKQIRSFKFSLGSPTHMFILTCRVGNGQRYLNLTVLNMVLVLLLPPFFFW
jgi:hypothetical protein